MHLLIRFIPTRVGYTSKFQHSERFRPVHPHSRGVYAARKLDFWEAFGSSPLAWGIPWNAAQKQGKTFGSSPLAWGIRSAVLTSTSEFAVHPHSRGVYSAIPVICFNRYTVHPHSRGVYLHQGYLTLSPLRFIPTRVGYTMFWQTVQFRRNGSSPLAWGILPRFLDYPLACKVHPHSRGVYTTKASLIELSTRFIPTRVGYTARAIASHLQKSGSSPLAWGIPPSPYFSPPPTRFIPTRVGDTRFPSAHPHNVFWFIPTRVGYTFSSNVATPPISGSSPLAWGIRH